MAFIAIIEKLEDVPENFREHYKQVGDVFHLDTDHTALGYEDATALKKSNKRLKKEREDLRTELEPLKQFSGLLDVEGFNPSEVETLMASAAGNGDNQAIEDLQRKHGKTLKDLQEQLADAQNVGAKANQEKDNYIIENTLQSAAIKAKVRKDSLGDVVTLNRNSVLIEDGVVYMKDSEGDSTGKTPEQFFSEDYKKDKPQYFESDGTGGTGHLSKGGNNSDGAVTTYKTSSSLKDKVAALESKISAGKA